MFKVIHEFEAACDFLLHPWELRWYLDFSRLIHFKDTVNNRRPLMVQHVADFKGVELSKCQIIGSVWDILTKGALKPIFKGTQN